MNSININNELFVAAKERRTVEGKSVKVLLVTEEGGERVLSFGVRGECPGILRAGEGQVRVRARVLLR